MRPLPLAPALVLAVAVAAASWLLTRAARRYALASALLDVPNERSSHSVPTPRGGGVAIAATLLGALALAWALGWLPGALVTAVGGGGALLALTGWLDDRWTLPTLPRLAMQTAAAVWAVAWIGGMPALDLGAGTLPLGGVGAVLAVVVVVWMTNLYNFMDGIDGLAAGQAVVAGAAGSLLLVASGHAPLALVALLTAAASAGFLPWNWSPARIFMGDVSSGLLGFVFGAAAVASERAGAVPLLAWVVLLGVFAFDATVTLLRRAARGERWYSAHRSHAYQRLVQAGWSHARVTSAALAFAVVLAAAAAAGTRWRMALPWIAVAALATLGAAYGFVERRRPMPPTPRRAEVEPADAPSPAAR